MDAANRFEDLGGNKSVQVGLFFILFAVVTSFISSPFWQGDLLSILPDLPPALQEAPEEVEIASSEPAPVIDLPSTIPEANNQAVVTDGDTSSSGGGDDPGAENAGAAAGTAEDGQTDSSGTSQEAELGQLHNAIKELAAQLGEDKDYLNRPCRIESSDGLCLHRQLDRYLEQLRLVATGEAEEPVRMSQFGDSMVMGDQFCGELRRLMQGQFGDGGHGWMYPGNPVRRFGFENIRLGLSDRWTVRTIVTNSERGGNLFGFAGAEFRATDGPTFTMHAYDESPGDTFERIGIQYFASPGVEEGSVFVSVDGDRYQETFETTPASSGIHWIEVPRGNHSVTLSYFLPGLRYYGIISELSGPGVVVDNVGLVSSRMRFLDKIGEEHWRDQIRLRDPDLMSFLYGGNAAGESQEAFLRHEDEYKQEYEDILDQLRRNNPEVDCLMMSVLTRAKREGGRIEVYGAIPEIARAQREIAAENKCALFDLYALMGGKEGAEAWYRNSPQLLGSDLSHPTRAGYEEIARAFYTELMYAFADYLEERAERIAAGHDPIAPLEEATAE